MTPTITTTLTFKLPYSHRQLTAEIKNRGGRFNGEDKTWQLPDTTENKVFVTQLSAPSPKPLATPAERIQTVAKVATELINGLKVGAFTLIEASTERVVIQAVKAA